MIPVYQRTGAKTGEPGDCFAACLASLFHLSLNAVPNFNEGAQERPAITRREFRGTARLASPARLRVHRAWLSPAVEGVHAGADADRHAEYVLPVDRSYRHVFVSTVSWQKAARSSMIRPPLWRKQPAWTLPRRLLASWIFSASFVK